MRNRARQLATVAAAALATIAALAVLLLLGGRPATALDEELDLPDGTSASADPADELDVFQTFETVRAALRLDTQFRIPLSWIPGAQGFQIDNGVIIIESDEHRIHIVTMPASGSKFSAGFWMMLDWDNGTTDVVPELTASFKVENLPLEDLNELFDLGNEVPIALKRGWVTFSSAATSDTIITYTIDELPTRVQTYLGVGTSNPAISADEPLELAAGANFIAEVDITQARALRQTFALAGVKEVDLVLRGMLAADASSLFGDGDDASLLQFHMAVSLNAVGSDPPPWLEDRTAELEFGFDDGDSSPYIGIVDTVQTLVGDASNTFRRGVRFDPAIFSGVGGDVPLLMNFDLIGAPRAPYEIDLAGLLGVTSVDDITFGATISVSLDLTQDDPITAIDFEFQFTFGSTTITMKVDTEPNGTAFAVLSLVDAGTLSQLADRLSAVFGVPSPELDPIGQLGVPDVTVKVKKIGDTSTVELLGTVDVYDDVFGVEWLDLDSLALDVTFSNKSPNGTEDTPSIVGSLTAGIDLGGRPWTAKVAVEGLLKSDAVSIEGKVSLSLGDGQAIGIGPVVTIFENQFPDLPEIPTDLANLSLRDIELSLVASRAPTGFSIAFDAFAVTEIPVLEVDAAMYLRAGVEVDQNGDPKVLFDLGLRPVTPTKLSDLIVVPGLSDDPATSPELPAFAFVVTTGTSRTPLNQLTRAGFDFYKGLYGCEQSATRCAAFLDLKPGVNLVANLAAFPEALDPLIEALWMDPDQGLQFIGRIPFFGAGAEVDLQIRLPRIVPPPEVDFLTGGQLAIGISAGTDGLETYVQGQMDTRWRRSEANPGSCVGIGGELQTGYDQIDADTIVTNEYCYDVLKFALESGISLSKDGLKAKLSGGVIADSGYGWEEPFGVPGITIRSLKLAMEVGFEPPSSLSFAGGFAGDIIIGDPDNGGKQFFGSAGVGFSIVPAPTPAGVTIVPKFVGVRGYVSSIGMTDVARLWEFLFPDAPAITDLTGFPLAELRNAELMFALGDNEDLCLTTGVYLAGELYLIEELSPPGPVVVPPTNDEGCAEFGALVNPDTCLSDDPDTGRRAEGCFATFFGKLAFTGIVADGRIGALDLGPIHYDDAQLTFKLTPAEQALIVRGGMHVIDPSILDGEMSLAVGLTKLDFYGRAAAFGGFLVEVEGGYELGLAAPFTPTFDTTLHVVVGADFDTAFRNAAAPVLRAFSDTVATSVAMYEGLKATDGDPFETLRRLPDDLAAVGVTVPLWYDNPDENAIDLVGVLDGIADTMATAGIESPTMGQLFSGIELPEPFTLPGAFFAGTCYAAPFVEGVVVDGECYSVYIDRILGIGALVPGAPDSFTEFLEDFVEPALTQALRAVGLPDTTEFGDLGDELLARIDGAVAPVSLTCADFDLDTTSATPSVSLRLAGQVFGTEFGVNLGWNFAEPVGDQAAALASQLIGLVFGSPTESACAPIGPLPGPLDGEIGGEGDISFEPALSSDTIVEGDTVVLTGTYGEGLDDAEAASVDWGDGAPVPTTVGALRAGLVSPVYRDDDPSGTSSDVEVISVTIGDVTREVAVRVRNDRPAIATFDVPDRIDEGAPMTVRGTFTDAGLDDDFDVVVTWGDGSPATPAEVAPSATPGTWTFEASHPYADDDPSLTSSDTELVRVVVTDDDLGSVSTQRVVYVDDVAPSNVTVEALLGAGETIREGEPVTFRVSWTDPGADTFWVVVEDFGDGTGTTVFSAKRSVDVTHVYADDDPTGTRVDTPTVVVRVTDDDTLSATGSVDVELHNVDPVVELTAPSGDTSVTVQYSDPIGGWVDQDAGTHGIDPVVITAYDVTADTVSLSATIVEQGSGDTPAALPAWLVVGDPVCVPDAVSDYHSTCTWELSADVPGVDRYVHTDLPPGVYEIVVTVTDDDTGTGSATLTVEVLPEDARVWYVGPTFAATDSVNDDDVDVELRATVRDISSIDLAADPWPGDIRNAALTFVDRESATTSAFECARAGEPPVAVDAVFSPFDVFDPDRSIGVGNCVWTATVDDADPYLVGSIVGGYYERDNMGDDAVVTVARPLDEFITGGGYLILTDSAGEYPGEDLTHANYGFSVKFNKKGTNLQGRVTIVFRIGDRTYRIKSNAIDSLGVYPGSELEPADDFLHAEFEAKANLTDVTDPDDPAPMDGNLVLQMRMTDASEDGVADTIAFTLWDVRREGGGKNATYTQLLQFSSNWDGNQTQEQTVAGGNIMVHD